MKRSLKRILKTIVVIALGLVVLLAGAALFVITNTPLVKRAAQDFVFKKTGIELTIGRLNYRLSPLRVEAGDVGVSYTTGVYSLQAVIRQAKARGDLRKFLRGERQALEIVEADFEEFRLTQTRKAPVPKDLERLLQSLGTRLDRSRRISLRFGKIIVRLLNTDLRADGATLEIAGGKAGDAGKAFEIAFDCADLAAVRNRGKTTFNSRFQANGELILGPTVGFDARLVFAGPRAVVSGKAGAVESLTVGFQGAWHLKDKIVRVPGLTLDVPGLASLEGTAAINLGPNTSLEAGVKAVVPDLESLLRTAGPFLPSTLRALALRGKAGLEARYASPQVLDGRPGTLSAGVKTEGITWSYTIGGRALNGSLSGTLEAAGPVSDPRISGDVRIETGRLAGKGALVQGTSARLGLSGSKQTVKISIPSATLQGVSVEISPGRTIAFEKIGLAGNIEALRGNSPSVEADLEARLPGLAPVRVGGRAGVSPMRLRRLRVGTTDQNIPALRGLLGPFLPPALASWSAGGTIDASLNADWPGRAKDPIRLRGRIDLFGGTFSDPDFTVASEGLRARLSIEGDRLPGSRDFTGKAEVEVLEGESLWNHSYISWAGSPLKAGITARYDSAAGSLEVGTSTAAVAGLGEVRASGRLRLAAPRALSLLTESRFDLGAAARILAEGHVPERGRPRFSGEIMSDLEVIKDDNGFSLRGRLRLKDAAVTGAESGFSIPRLSADLPVSLALAGTPLPAPAGAPAGTGMVSLGEVRASGFSVRIPPLSVIGRTNAFQVEPFAIDLFGGRLEVGETTLALKTGPLSLAGASSLGAAGIGLSGLPFLPGKTALQGHVGADFPEVVITRESIRFSGHAVADVFGGQVIVTDLAVGRPFSAGRRAACDIELRGLDLKQITDLVSSGEVTGIVRGEVRDLVIAYGQPEQFTLTVASEDRKGVPRTFSLKALDSLTVITAGRPAMAGTGAFWLSFIKGLRYDRIGIRSTLKNDNFMIEGTIKEGGLEYLVKRPFLTGISVINRNPGKTIGFKDMMSRLRRVAQSGGPAPK